MEPLERHYDALRDDFRLFYPELQQYVKQEQMVET